MTSISSAVLTTLTACFFAAPVLTYAAEPANTSASITVRYTDLNLGTEAGTSALYARLVSAARKVCAPATIRDLDQVAAAQACEKEALANAVRDVHSAKLAAVFTAHQRHG